MPYCLDLTVLPLLILLRTVVSNLRTVRRLVLQRTALGQQLEPKIALVELANSTLWGFYVLVRHGSSTSI